LVLSNGTTNNNTSNAGRPDSASVASGNGAGGAGGTGSQASGSRAAASCAQSLPPASTATGKSSVGSLVTHPSDSVLLCGYRNGTRQLLVRDGRPVTLSLSGTQAAQVVTALEHAGEQAVPHNCPVTLENAGLVAVHVGSDPPITIDLGCGRTLYTDTVLKFGWQPPAFVEPFLSTVIAG
jgi:hypothetical protein